MAQDDNYERFKAQVNAEIFNIAAVGADDIDDFDYYSAFEAGQYPTDVAIEALENSGFPFERVEGADDSDDTHPRD